jgi:hypothetical protein
VLAGRWNTRRRQLAALEYVLRSVEIEPRH